MSLSSVNDTRLYQYAVSTKIRYIIFLGKFDLDMVFVTSK